MVTLLIASIVAKPKGEGSEGTQGGSNDSRSMDCCICSPTASIYRPPRNAICSSCYEGAKAIIGFFNNDERAEDDGHGLVKPRGLIKPNSSTKAARSDVFRHILSDDDNDQCKAPAGDSISLPELDHDDLYNLLAFLYTGALDGACTERHLHALLVAADKYDVPFLGRACEARLAASVEPRNVLRTLEVAELSSSAALKERAMDTVAEQAVFAPEYDDFAVRNASLCVEITRALLANKSTKSKQAREAGRIDQLEG